MRVLDLACGKGGDLGKWSVHRRGVSEYVGADVARGSLKDAAKRILQMHKRKGGRGVKFSARLICADLGKDVPSRRSDEMLTWVHRPEEEEDEDDPVFEMVPGGGVEESQRFDVVSIQFAVHYMMSTHGRARRFFKTVGDLLEIGGNLVLTTIDARVVLTKLMSLGLDLETLADDASVVVSVGRNKCRLTFAGSVVRRLLTGRAEGPDAFGLEYFFTLSEGDDHAAGVGEAVDLAEWLAPVPLMQGLGAEAGLELCGFENFHEFYENRKDGRGAHHAAHKALYNMHVLNCEGSISEDEWEVSRMYVAVKFVKVRECRMVLEEEEDAPEKETEDEKPLPLPQLTPDQMKQVPQAMFKVIKSIGKEAWNALSKDQQKRKAYQMILE